MKCTQCQQDKDVTAFYKRTSETLKGYHSECRSCFKTRLQTRNHSKKKLLVSEYGGACQHCGYNRSPHVLAFHHLDPSSKSFEISSRMSAPIELLRAEATKCILLCPNCHAEKHLGIW